MRTSTHSLVRRFKGGDDLLALDGRKRVQELFKAVAPLQVVDQISEGNARSDEHGDAAKNLRVAVYDGCVAGHAQPPGFILLRARRSHQSYSPLAALAGFVEPIERAFLRVNANVGVVLQHSAREMATDRFDDMIRFGYESEAAFSRAFKRFVGISPGAAWRREPRALHNAAVLPKR
jgi:hypothetical protein